MTTVLQILLFILGLGLVIKGGDLFVDASVWVSDVSGISKAVIGATLVSFATTAPELFTSVIATIKGYNELAVGNAVGSPIANLGIGFALIALFTPGLVTDKMFTVKGAIMIAATGLLLIFCLNGQLGPLEGVVLIALFAASMIINIKFSQDTDNKARRETNRREIIINVSKFVLGAAGLILGSDLLVDNGQKLALELGISPTIVGLTFVAIGTSLPELVTSITAIVKKQNSLSIGNLIGANVLDTTLILSLCSFVSGGGLVVARQTSRIDLPASLVIMLAAVVPIAVGKRLRRWQGGFMLAAYIAYLAIITVIA
jgi:cation:H+ antiporter